MLLELFGQQMLLRNHQLFLVRIGAKLDYLHAVKQRTRNGVRRIGRGDKHTLAQVKGQLKKIVAEGRVLFGIQHLQKCRRGVAAVIAAQLVDLIEKQQRIFGPGLLDGGQDTSRHRADIGFSVTADLGLVVDASEGNARQFAVERARDAHGNRGFSHARRADQTDDLPGKLRRKLLDRQNLKDPLLNLFQPEVILVEDTARRPHIPALLAAAVPRQLQRNVQVITDHGCLGRAEGLLHQALEFAVQLRGNLLRQRQFFNFLPVLFKLRFVVALAQLIADDLHLLPQIIIPLTLVDVLLGHVLKLVFQPQNLQLPCKELVGNFQTPHGMPLLQNTHFFRVTEGGALTHQIRDIARVIRGQKLQHCLLYRALCEIGKFVKKLRGLTIQRLNFWSALDILQVRKRFHARAEIGCGLLYLRHLCAAFAHNEHAHGVSGHFQYLTYTGDGSDGVQAVEGGIILQNILLCHQKDALIGGHRLVQRADRLFPPNIKMHRCLGENRQPAQGQYRHPLR